MTGSKDKFLENEDTVAAIDVLDRRGRVIRKAKQRPSKKEKIQVVPRRTGRRGPK